MTDTLTFPNHDGVTGAPTIDGFFDLDYMTTGEVPESGFAEGSQYTFGDGGIAPFVFRGIRNAGNGRIVMGFMLRLTGTFSNDNRLIIAMKPDSAVNDPLGFRMIEIAPVDDSIGSDAGVGVGPNNIKTNIDPENPPSAVNLEVFYRKMEETAPGSGVFQWVTYSSQANTTIRVRSWEPDHTGNDEAAWSVEIELPTTTADGGPDWIDLANDFGLYFCAIEIVPVSPAMATEYVFPLGAPPFLSLLSFTNPQFGHGLLPPIPAGAVQGIDFVDPAGWPSVGRRPENSTSTTLTSLIESEVDGTGDDEDNELVAIIKNTGASDVTGVTADFRFKNYGLPPGSPANWDRPNGLQPNPTTPTTVTAGATNVALVADWPIASVPTTTPTSFHQCMWVQLDAGSTAPFARSSIRRNMNIEPFSTVEQDAEVSGEGYEEPANGTDEHDFILQTFARKLIVPELIKNEKTLDPATIGLVRTALTATRERGDDRPADDDPRPDDRNAIRNLAAAANIRATSRNVRDRYRDTVVYIWITRGYRVTDQTVTIGQNTYPLLDNGCGQFGVVGPHEGIKDSFNWQFRGPKLAQFKPGLYALKVPHKGAARLHMRLEADADVRPGDNSDLARIEYLDPKKPWKMQGGSGQGGKPKPGLGADNDDKKGGCLGLAAGLIALPFGVIASLYGVGVF